MKTKAVRRRCPPIVGRSKVPGNGCQRRRDESAIIGPTHFYGVVIDGIDAIETETNTDEDEHGPFSLELTAKLMM